MLQQGWLLVDPGLPGMLQQDVKYPGRAVTAATEARVTGTSYSVMPSAAAGHAPIGAVALDPSIRTRGSALAARATWQQQQVRLQQHQQQQHQQPLQNQQHQQQQQAQQQYGYSAVSRPVFMRRHHA
jgi:hypothetical protein